MMAAATAFIITTGDSYPISKNKIFKPYKESSWLDAK